MQRYFVDIPLDQDVFDMTDSNQLHHIMHVMRMKLNDKIIVCDSKSQCFQVKINALSKDKVTCEKILALPLIKKPYHVTLAQSLIRKDHFELVFQKATELGADTIIPIETERTIIQYKEKNIDQKMKRWDTIITEASEQSHRNTKAKLEALLPLKQLDFSRFDHVFVAYEQEKTVSFKTALKQVKPNDHILIIIGPEGGFSEKEITYLNHEGAISVSLGPRILRSETAALYALSAVSIMLEMSD
jgi:16S rRNA (uracil1498-N3)-methyltransferase